MKRRARLIFIAVFCAGWPASILAIGVTHGWSWSEIAVRRSVVFQGWLTYPIEMIRATILQRWDRFLLLYWSLYLGMVGAIYLLLCLVPVRKRNPDHCSHCGYNLTGNVSGICPECGGFIAARDRQGQ